MFRNTGNIDMFDSTTGYSPIFFTLKEPKQYFSVNDTAANTYIPVLLNTMAETCIVYYA